MGLKWGIHGIFTFIHVTKHNARNAGKGLKDRPTYIGGEKKNRNDKQ